MNWRVRAPLQRNFFAAKAFVGCLRYSASGSDIMRSHFLLLSFVLMPVFG